MPHPLSHQLEITDQAIMKDGSRCSYVNLNCEVVDSWSTMTIYSSGGSADDKDEAYAANRKFAERIVKALALLEFFEVCEPTKQFLNTHTHENN